MHLLLGWLYTLYSAAILLHKNRCSFWQQKRGCTRSVSLCTLWNLCQYIVHSGNGPIYWIYGEPPLRRHRLHVSVYLQDPHWWQQQQQQQEQEEYTGSYCIFFSHLAVKEEEKEAWDYPQLSAASEPAAAAAVKRALSKTRGRAE